MNKSTTSLSFPDVNVWFAILLADHIHRPRARAWWEAADSTIAFTRFTGLSVLRLLTTPPAMEAGFRKYTSGRTASPKLWADAWLLAFAEAAAGSIITFDKALAARAA